MTSFLLSPEATTVARLIYCESFQICSILYQCIYADIKFLIFLKCLNIIDTHAPYSSVPSSALFYIKNNAFPGMCCGVEWHMNPAITMSTIYFENALAFIL